MVDNESSSHISCPTCGDEFGSERAVANHHQSHHRPYFDAKMELKYGVPAGWLLHTMYAILGKSTREIADDLGYSKSVLTKHLKRHGVRLRPSNRDKPVRFATMTNTNGFSYEQWEHNMADGRANVYHHRLLAVAEYGFDAVCDMDVHHINEIGWDNRPDNIELMEHGEHRSYHNRS